MAAIAIQRFTVASGAATLACARFGAGPPLVCVHALGFSKEYFVAAAEVLGHDYDCIAYDQRGHGETVAPLAAAAFTPAALAGDLGAVLDALGLAAACVGGISLGAATALVFARGAPRRVRQLVQDLPAFGPGPGRDPAHGAAIAAAFDAGDLAAAARLATAGLGAAPARALAALLAAQWARVPAAALGPKLALAFRATARWRIAEDWPAGFAGLDVPTHVLGLAGDPLHPLAIAETLARTLPRARLWKRVPSVQPAAVARQWVTVLATPP